MKILTALKPTRNLELFPITKSHRWGFVKVWVITIAQWCTVDNIINELTFIVIDRLLKLFKNQDVVNFAYLAFRAISSFYAALILN